MVNTIIQSFDIWSEAQGVKTNGRIKSTENISLEGISRLRELILELAVMGKLVPQDINDEPASVFIQKVINKKKKLEKEGKIKKQKLLPEITEEDIAFNLPESWVWMRLGNYSYIFSGNNFKSNDFNKKEGAKVIKITNAGVHTFNETDDYLPFEFVSKHEDYLVQKDDLIIALTRPYINSGLKISSCPSSYHNSLLNQRVAAIRFFQNNAFPFYYLKSPIVLKHYQSRFGNSGLQPNLKLSDVTELLIPIPPIEEQKRIVAKVDELMLFCEKLEKEQSNNLKTHQTLVKTLLETLTYAKGANELQIAWERIESNFDILFCTEESIEQLKQTILQLAVMGKLVNQDPADEPANVLLEKIEIEKEKLINDGVIKKQKPLPEITDEEKSFDLPLNWSWSRLNYFIDVRDGTHDSPKDAFGPNTYPLVTSKNFVDGKIDFDGARRISEKDHNEISKRSKVDKLDILFSMIGGNLGNQVQVMEEVEFSIKNVALYKYYSKELSSPFFVKKFMEYLALDLQQKAIGGAQPFVSLGFLRNLPIAVPPFREQLRIVDKTNELLSMCDNLKNAINNAQELKNLLSRAIVEKAVQ